MRLLETTKRIRRILGKSPGYVARRALHEGEREIDRWLAPVRERRLGKSRLLALAQATSVDQLWSRLRGAPFPAWTAPIEARVLDELVPGESVRILDAAEKACRRIVDVLGTGPVALGKPIDWARDYRVGMDWPSAFARSIDYVNRDRPSDVKVPWEISRLQWLIPAGQAYLLTGDERYAGAARDVLMEWISANPLAYTVNWSCTMEAAMRLFTWTWLFHVFAGSNAWRDEHFRVRFLACLYLHGDFTRRHIEVADINGNHYTADLAGLVMAGYFFGEVGDARRWRDIGWSGLRAEIERQVFDDGVDYEASVAYHRLVCELFAWPALFGQAVGETVPTAYAKRLCAMGQFASAYSREDGTSPLWGDADDARALPFGGQKLGDHRYLIGLVGIAVGNDELAAKFNGSVSELIWITGPNKLAALSTALSRSVPSTAFTAGGVYIMRHNDHHVFIDCGPVGLAGRGGHGHNDALSFEARLNGALLVVDRGSFAYTASFEKRNEFRSTASHNTPQVGQEEINRFDPNDLWNMQNDAKAECVSWRSNEVEDVLVGRHHGYQRLGIKVQRTIRLEKETGCLDVADRIEGEGFRQLTVPLHLAPQVSVTLLGTRVGLQSDDREFIIVAEGEGWTLEVEPTTISPSYGVLVPSKRLVWRRTGSLPASLHLAIQPAPSKANSGS
ncbi:alginate lyase family protein [Bradyrhizobium sp.]|uniref:alginate lyase family protein n=1 Tax=Bradyrhizobium sp. TaxID=376 RepID=UPI001D7BB390|nr:alginate lyase family protein [Bradyrhizobium sp.]MBI5321091.1 alginate lyase family protein [Bradyrhizobium sp.]